MSRPPADDERTEAAETPAGAQTESSDETTQTVNDTAGTNAGETNQEARTTQVDTPHDDTVTTAVTADSAPRDVGPEVESNWCYWVAAVPGYFLLGVVGAVAVGVLFLLTAIIDVAGGMGIATGILLVVFVLGSLVYALAGVVLVIMFPVGIYLDAKAINESAAEWDPDPVLYGLIAVATALFSALTVSLVIALYYLYRRNQYLGTP